MQKDYEPGERVTAEVRDARVVARDDRGRLVLEYGDGQETLVDVAAEMVRVTRVTPADGEPQPGEVWRDGLDQVWSAIRSNKSVVFVGAHVDAQHHGRWWLSWQDVHQGLTGPIRRVWSSEAEQAVDAAATTHTAGQYAHGYAEAVARLRDNEQYRDWWSNSPESVRPTEPIRGHLADYLETAGPFGPDVTAYRSRDERLADIVAQALVPFRAEDDSAVRLSTDAAARIAVGALVDAWAFGPGVRCTRCGEQLPRATGNTTAQCHTCSLGDPGGPVDLEESTSAAARRMADELERLRLGLLDRHLRPDPWAPADTAPVDLALTALDRFLALFGVLADWRDRYMDQGSPDWPLYGPAARAVDELRQTWPGVDLSPRAGVAAEVHALADPSGVLGRLEALPIEPVCVDERAPGATTAVYRCYCDSADGGAMTGHYPGGGRYCRQAEVEDTPERTD